VNWLSGLLMTGTLCCLNASLMRLSSRLGKLIDFSRAARYPEATVHAATAIKEAMKRFMIYFLFSKC
jgi:hypothetical protein